MRQHIYILTASHGDYTQGDEIHGVYTSERKAKVAARALAQVGRLTWESTGTVKTHRRFSLSADSPEEEDAFPWHYTIHVVRPE
jgi:hypothetical protein